VGHAAAAVITAKCVGIPPIVVVPPTPTPAIMALINIQADAIGHEELRVAFTQRQEVLMRVAQYLQPNREVQMVC
jgi:hypothetical protein